jgi:hypothetical protein
MVMSPAELGTKYDSAVEDQQKFTRDRDQNSDTLHALFLVHFVTRRWFDLRLSKYLKYIAFNGRMNGE